MTLKNFDRPVLNPKGEPFQVAGVDVTMTAEIFTALMHPEGWDENQYMRKVAAGALGVCKIYPGGDVELTASEMEIIRERVAKILPPMSCHRIMTYLDDKDDVVKPKEKPAKRIPEK